MKYTALLPLLLLSAGSAFAGLDVSLLSAVESGPPGGFPNSLCMDGSASCLIFSGTITDSDLSTSYYLLDFDLEFGPGDAWLTSGTCLSDADNCGNLFFTLEGPPGEFDPGDSYTGPLFEVDVDPVNPGDPTTPIGVYDGDFTLLGNTDDSFEEDPLADPISIEVDVTPEPATFLLAFPGLAGLLLIRVARR